VGANNHLTGENFVLLVHYWQELYGYAIAEGKPTRDYGALLNEEDDDKKDKKGFSVHWC